MNDKWLKGYYIATYILAIIAVAGFVYSIVSSRSTSETLKSMQQELSLSNRPLIKMDDYNWYNESGELSCDNPPIGIAVDYRNFSTVPIQIYKADVKYFYGEKEFTDVVLSIGEASQIVPPGEKFTRGTIQKELFQKYLKNKKSVVDPPFLRIKAQIEFSCLGSSERYLYEVIQDIGFDCSNPEATQKYPVEEKISQISN